MKNTEQHSAAIEQTTESVEELLALANELNTMENENQGIKDLHKILNSLSIPID